MMYSYPCIIIRPLKCYVGQKKLNAAVASFASQSSSPPTTEVEWKPYIIDPNTATEGEEFEAYNIRRWGSSGWTHGLKRSGQKVGANFSNWKIWPNTLRAHQLIAYVTNPARKAANNNNNPSTSECNAAIFDAMYERGKNVSLVETLVEIGTERLGISTNETNDLRLYLENNTGARDVMKEIQTGRRKYNIKGVPFFVIEAIDGEESLGRPYGFSGAQDSSTFLEIFNALAGKLAE